MKDIRQPKIPTSKKSNENMDLQILSSALDTIFINSHNYDEIVLIDITKALFECCKRIINENEFKNDHLVTYLHFNLTKLLELSVINIKRIYVFWDVIVPMIEFITQNNIMNISLFSMDCLAIILLFAFNQFRPIINEKNNPKVEMWSDQKWQKTLIRPYKSIAKLNVAYDINTNIVFCLSKIMQNCGTWFNTRGWSSFIEICFVLIDKADDETLIENGKK